MYLRSCLQIDFTDTREQVEEILFALWKASGSLTKVFLRSLAFHMGELATASTVEEWDECLDIISRYVRHPKTFEQSSDAARFISMLREGSISTIHEVKALLATALLALTVVAEDDNTSGGIPMQIDDLGQDCGFDRMSIIDVDSEGSSAKSRMSISDIDSEGSSAKSRMSISDVKRH